MMEMNSKMIWAAAIVAILVVGGAAAVLAINNSDDDDVASSNNMVGRLTVFGNANNDDYINSDDVDEIKAILAGEKEPVYFSCYKEYKGSVAKRSFADANADGTIDETDLQMVQDMVDRKEGMKIYFYDVDGVISSCTYPLTTAAVGYKSNYESLKTIFKESPLPIMTHCEDTEIIDANMAEYKAHHGEDPDVKFHPEIRSVEACLKSTELAVKLARETGARLHVAHITTADELELIPKSKAALNGNGEDKFENITAEACVSHLMFNDADYQTLGTRIKCNPAIKGEQHQKALQKALFDGRIAVVGTDHAPHLLSEKEGGCAKAVSGMPMLQFSLVSMLDLMTTLCNNDRQQAAIQTTRLMCHNPASLFGIRRRGYIRVGYKADFVIVREAEWTLKQGDIISKCGWSPLEGRKFHHQVYATYCNGNKVFDIKQGVDRSCIGEAVSFDR